MSCRICSRSNFTSIIDLGNQPWGNDFICQNDIGKEKSYPLHLILCDNCFLVQLGFTVAKEIMFADHTYLTGITSTLKKNFESVKLDLLQNLNKFNNKNILDIGSNDGTFLKIFKDDGWNVLGVESSKRISEAANDNGINTLNEFFNFNTAKSINAKFDVINASGVFFHLEEIHSVTEGIKYLLDKNGVFIIQFIYLGSILNHTAFDQIYHEHLMYYSINSLSKLLEMYGLEIFDGYLTEVHGGQMVCYATHKNTKTKTNRYKELVVREQLMGLKDISTYKKFEQNVIALKEKNLDYFNRNRGKKIFGFGAPVKGNTLLNYFGLTKKDIIYLVEKNEMRKNLYSPGSHIPIILESELHEKPDIYYVLAWNFKKEILQNNQTLIENGVEFYFPINA